jgi:hypothetical protein
MSNLKMAYLKIYPDRLIKLCIIYFAASRTVPNPETVESSLLTGQLWQFDITRIHFI